MSDGAPRAGGERALALDALKGLIMVVMALDHVKSFLMKYDGTKEIWSAPALYTADVWNFAARYISHLAAPGFFFMMGMGMVLFAAARTDIGWSNGRIARNFVIRGLILVALQFVAENPAWIIRSGNVERILSTGVLSTLGLAMVLSALALCWRPAAVVAASAACVLATQLFVAGLGMEVREFPLIVRLLVVAGDAGMVRVNYPLIPWLGVTGFGMAYGWYWVRDRDRAYRHAMSAGLALLAAFFVIRGVGGFGNLRPAVDTGALAFLQVTKYPPSLSFLALTLGVNFLVICLLWMGEGLLARFGGVLLAYGRSPLFFYVAHLYIYALMSLVVYNRNDHILSLAGLCWLLGLAMLWPLCKWYGDFKRTRGADSIWRLF